MAAKGRRDHKEINLKNTNVMSAFKIAPRGRVNELLREPSFRMAGALIRNERAHQRDLGLDAVDECDEGKMTQEQAVAHVESLVRATALLHAKLERVLEQYPVDGLVAANLAATGAAAAMGYNADCDADGLPGAGEGEAVPAMGPGRVSWAADTRSEQDRF